MAPGASRLSRPLLPGLDFDAPPARQQAWPAKPQARQDHRPRTPEPGPDARRGAPGEESHAPSPGPLFDRPQGQPRFRDGADRAGEAAHSTQTDGERCPGDGTRGATEAPVGRVADLLDLSRAAFPRRSQSLHPPSHTPRLAAQSRAPSKQSLLLFDRPAAQPPGATNSTANEPLARTNASPHQAPTAEPPQEDDLASASITSHPPLASGEKAKAKDLLDAIRTLKHLEHEGRPPTSDERQALMRFGGFGPVALSLFPDPVTGSYKDPAWQSLGEMLRMLLSPEEYESAKRTTFNAFYTSPTVIRAMHEALGRLGVPREAIVLEPGCGTGNFMALAPEGMRFIGVELDSLSGRIARTLHPAHDIRIENFRDTKLPEGCIDAVIGNVPFADVKLEHRGLRLSLHDFFFAKAIDVLKPGGVLALVTSHFTLDKQNAAVREYLAGRADFLGAIRLPSDAFKREGTSVVTDIVFLQRRGAGEPARHVDPAWLETEPLPIEGALIPINRYFLKHPQMVLGAWSRKDRLYDAGYSVIAWGDLAVSLTAAIRHLPEGVASPVAAVSKQVSFTPPPPERHLAEGGFFIAGDRTIHQLNGGQATPVTYGGTVLKAHGTMTGRRLAALVGLRDHTRRVLQSQNEGWPDRHRHDARRALNGAYDLFVTAYGPINKTTFSETSDGRMIRRMPNLVKFREDPDAMLVMSLEVYDEVTGRRREGGHHAEGCRRPSAAHHRGAERGRRLTRLPRPPGHRGSPLHRHALREVRGEDHRGALRPHLPRPRIKNVADRRCLSLGQRQGETRRSPEGRPGLRPERRRAFRRAARGRAPRRHRRQSRRPVDTGTRHP